MSLNELKFWVPLKERIERIIKDTMFHMMGNIFPYPFTLERSGRIHEMTEYFSSLENVEKYVKELQDRFGKDVKVKLTKHHGSMFDITIDHTYHVDISDIGIVERNEDSKDNKQLVS